MKPSQRPLPFQPNANLSVSQTKALNFIQPSNQWEYVPFQRTYIETVPVKKVEYVSRLRKRIDYLPVERQRLVRSPPSLNSSAILLPNKPSIPVFTSFKTPENRLYPQTLPLNRFPQAGLSRFPIVQDLQRTQEVAVLGVGDEDYTAQERVKRLEHHRVEDLGAGENQQGLLGNREDLNGEIKNEMKQEEFEGRDQEVLRGEELNEGRAVQAIEGELMEEDARNLNGGEAIEFMVRGDLLGQESNVLMVATENNIVEGEESNERIFQLANEILEEQGGILGRANLLGVEPNVLIVVTENNIAEDQTENEIFEEKDQQILDFNSVGPQPTSQTSLANPLDQFVSQSEIWQPQNRHSLLFQRAFQKLHNIQGSPDQTVPNRFSMPVRQNNPKVIGILEQAVNRARFESGNHFPLMSHTLAHKNLPVGRLNSIETINRESFGYVSTPLNSSHISVPHQIVRQLLPLQRLQTTETPQINLINAPFNGESLNPDISIIGEVKTTSQPQRLIKVEDVPAMNRAQKRVLVPPIREASTRGTFKRPELRNTNNEYIIEALKQQELTNQSTNGLGVVSYNVSPYLTSYLAKK